MIDNFYYVDANIEGRQMFTRVREPLLNELEAIRLRAENMRRTKSTIKYDSVYDMTLTN